MLSPFVDKIADILEDLGLDPRVHVGRHDVRSVQERRAIESDFDECRLHAGQDA